MAVYGLAIFLSAFLLFQVQLFLAKYILPWFGGVPSVWTTCMLFFQVLLLGGYAYAHWLTSRLAPRAQRRLHLALLVASLALLATLFLTWGSPVLPDASWKPRDNASPIWQIVRLLAVAVGLPFFVLATTGPLVQAWFSIAFPRTSPYRLYALSNLGSLLGLLSYPFLIEVWLPLQVQALLWAAGFVVFTASMCACALKMARTSNMSTTLPAGVNTPRPPWTQYLLWFALAACASMLLLATTNQMSQEVAVVPFLWMLPLCLYLLSFILCFNSERWYGRGTYGILLVLGLVLSVLVLDRGVFAHLLLQIAVPAFTLFAACMVCHGELARLKPSARHLTSFYLTVTAGGAGGGLFVGLAAPVMFPGMWEYPIALWATAALLFAMHWRDRESRLQERANWLGYASVVAAVALTLYSSRELLLPQLPALSDDWLFGTPVGVAVAGFLVHGLLQRQRQSALPGQNYLRRRRALLLGGALSALLFLGVTLAYLTYLPLVDSVYQARNFYGVLHVVEDDANDRYRHQFKLRHGRIIHGYQFQSTVQRRMPTSYYGYDSGVGLAIEHHPRRFRGLRVGVVGLGIGTLAAYGQPRDTFRFYEINPEVLALAGPTAQTFSYVRDSRAHFEFALGDARIELEKELAERGTQRFDVLALDAFSSDSIPVHLLTREAVEVYLQHLDPDGILAIHISNRSLDLAPVVRGLAQHFGLAHVLIDSAEGNLTWSSTWALLARDPRLFATAAIAAAAATSEDTAATLWTDDYSNLLRVLKF